jgi:hypothetical protein
LFLHQSFTESGGRCTPQEHQITGPATFILVFCQLYRYVQLSRDCYIQSFHQCFTDADDNFDLSCLTAGQLYITGTHNYRTYKIYFGFLSTVQICSAQQRLLFVKLPSEFHWETGGVIAVGPSSNFGLMSTEVFSSAEAFIYCSSIRVSLRLGPAVHHRNTQLQDLQDLFWFSVYCTDMFSSYTELP